MNKLSDYYVPPFLPRCVKCHKPALSFNLKTGLCDGCQEQWTVLETLMFREFITGELLPIGGGK